MGKPSPPKPQDPGIAIDAQQKSNADTARLEANLNRVNEISPYGTVRYEQTSPDRWTRYIEPSDRELEAYNRTNDVTRHTLEIANEHVPRIGNALGQGFSYDGLPELQTAQGMGSLVSTPSFGDSQRHLPSSYELQHQVGGSPQYQTSIDGAGQNILSTPAREGMQRSFDPGYMLQGSVEGVGFEGHLDPTAAVQTQMGPTDFTADRNAVTDAVIGQARSRLDPYWNTQEDRLRTRLSNQGFGSNSTAAQSQLDEFSRGRNDAYNQAVYSGIQQGAAEQNQLFNQRLQQGQFANDAQGQQWDQAMGRRMMLNDTAQRQLDQQLRRAEFTNNSRVQQYDLNRGQAEFTNQAAKDEFDQTARYYDIYNRAQQQGFDQRVTAGEFGNSAADRLFAQNLARGQFANQATGQRFAQDLGQAELYNAGTQQDFGNRMAAGNFYNQAAKDTFNAGLQQAQFNNQTRSQGAQERAYAQNMPINQLSALLGLGQVNMPQGVQFTPTGVGQTDAMGAYALNAQQQNAAYQAKMQNYGGLLGGLFGLGSAYIGR